MSKRVGTFRGFILGVLVCSLVMGFALPALAANYNQNINVVYRDIKMKINGNTITPRDASGSVVEPFIYNGTTYLPVRAVGDAVGYTVNWDQNSATVDLVGRGTYGNTPTPNDSGTPNNTTTYVNMIDVHPPYSVSSTWQIEYFPSTAGSGITMAGKSYKNSIYIGGGDNHASFNLSGKYSTLSGVMGAVDGSTSNGSDYNLTVNFYGDGSLIKSVEVTPTGVPKDFSLNVDGVSDLKIEIATPNTNYIGNFSVGFGNLKLQ